MAACVSEVKMASPANSYGTAPDIGKQKRVNLLNALPPEARGIALVVLLAEAVVVAVITLLPAQQRIIGYLIFGCICVVAIVRFTKPATANDHSHPEYAIKVERLRTKLAEFRPDLIVAVARGGLDCAGQLSRQLGGKQVVPVVSITRINEIAGFESPFNRVGFTRQDLRSTPAKILILDDSCKSGRTLVLAKHFIEQSLGKGDLEIKTAVISFVDDSKTHVEYEPDYYVDRPLGGVRDSAGQWE